MSLNPLPHFGKCTHAMRWFRGTIRAVCRRSTVGLCTHAMRWFRGTIRALCRRSTVGLFIRSTRYKRCKVEEGGGDKVGIAPCEVGDSSRPAGGREGCRPHSCRHGGGLEYFRLSRGVRAWSFGARASWALLWRREKFVSRVVETSSTTR